METFDNSRICTCASSAWCSPWPVELRTSKVQDGYGAVQSFSEAENVMLTYNEDGQLIDRGTTEGADAIMDLLIDDWGYPVVEADLDANDPLVNTASEYMYQMATIGYHTIHGTQTVVLTEPIEYNGESLCRASMRCRSRLADIGQTSIGHIRSRARLVRRHGQEPPTVCLVNSVLAP